jgi:hypothetical protein
VTSDNAIPSGSRKVPPPRRAEAEFPEQHSPDLALRKTGIRVMGDMPWALCVFFETKEDLLDTVATYFAAGIGKQRTLRVGDLRPDHGGGRKEGATPRNSGF